MNRKQLDETISLMVKKQLKENPGTGGNYKRGRIVVTDIPDEESIQISDGSKMIEIEYKDLKFFAGVFTTLSKGMKDSGFSN
jgi:hypothetical protein